MHMVKCDKKVQSGVNKKKNRVKKKKVQALCELQKNWKAAMQSSWQSWKETYYH